MKRPEPNALYANDEDSHSHFTTHGGGNPHTHSSNTINEPDKQESKDNYANAQGGEYSLNKSRGTHLISHQTTERADLLNPQVLPTILEEVRFPGEK